MPLTPRVRPLFLMVARTRPRRPEDFARAAALPAFTLTTPPHRVMQRTANFDNGAFVLQGATAAGRTPQRLGLGPLNSEARDACRGSR